MLSLELDFNLCAMRGYLLAALAGMCGSLASSSGKLIGYRALFFEICSENLKQFVFDNFCWCLVAIIQVLCIIVTLLLNSVMWTLFVESMQSLPTSDAMVINLGSNILLSALCGWVFYSENLSSMWWIGAAMIICGISVLLSK